MAVAALAIPVAGCMANAMAYHHRGNEWVKGMDLKPRMGVIFQESRGALSELWKMEKEDDQGKRKMEFSGVCIPSNPPSRTLASPTDLSAPNLHERISRFGAAITSYDFARNPFTLSPAKSLAFRGREGLNHGSKDDEMPIAIAERAKARPL